MSKLPHFEDNSIKTSSKSLNSPFAFLNATFADFKASSILFIDIASPSESTVIDGSFETS